MRQWWAERWKLRLGWIGRGRTVAFHQGNRALPSDYGMLTLLYKCQAAHMTCPHPGCELAVAASELSAHLRVCPYRLALCPNAGPHTARKCRFKGPWNGMDTHLVECAYNPYVLSSSFTLAHCLGAAAHKHVSAASTLGRQTSWNIMPRIVQILLHVSCWNFGVWLRRAIRIRWTHDKSFRPRLCRKFLPLRNERWISCAGVMVFAMPLHERIDPPHPILFSTSRHLVGRSPETRRSGMPVLRWSLRTTLPCLCTEWRYLVLHSYRGLSTGRWIAPLQVQGTPSREPNSEVPTWRKAKSVVTLIFTWSSLRRKWTRMNMRRITSEPCLRAQGKWTRTYRPLPPSSTRVHSPSTINQSKHPRGPSSHRWDRRP